MGRTIDISAPGGVADAYLTRPDDEPHPGLLFFVDAIGLRPQIEQMAVLEESGLSYVNEVYEGATHGYTMADTAPYNEAATERHFAALNDLFGRTLRA